jgi:hypothetical protein
MRDLPEFAYDKAFPIRQQMFIEAGIPEEGVPECDVRLPNKLGKYGFLRFADEYHGRYTSPCRLDKLRGSVQMMS